MLLAAVGAAFLTVAAAVLLTLWAYGTATGSTTPGSKDIDPVFEVRDKLIWVAALGAAGSLGLVLAVVRRPVRALLESWPILVLTLVGTAGIAFSAAWVDAQFGLEPVNLVVGVVVAPLLVLALRPEAERAVRLLWPAVAGVGIGLYLPALLQTPRGMYDALHGARNVDELLGPVAGNLPLADYVTQYGGMLGLPLVPFRALVSGHVEWSIMAYVSMLSIVTVAVACVAAALMLPRGRRALAPILVVPVLLMKPSAPDRLIPAGLQRLFQTMPERSLLPLLLAVALLFAASRPHTRGRWIAAGSVAGIAALNNFESGVPAAAAAVVTIVALRAGWRALGLFVAGGGGVMGAYVLLILLGGGVPRPEYWVAFGLEFAGGFAQFPIPPYGNYVFVLFILVATAASAFPVLWRRSAQLSVPAVGGLYAGTWGLVMFPYYVGRSSTMGQLQFFLIPGSIGAVWLLVGAAAGLRGRMPGPRLACAALLCCLPAAVFATAVIKAPSPETNLKRIMGGFAPAGQFRSTAWKLLPVVDTARARTILDVSAGAREPVGLFFNSGNVVALKTGLPNASILAVPEELLPHRPWSHDARTDTGNASFRRMQCQSLESSHLNSVIAEEAIAKGLDTCTGFSRGPASQGMVVFTRNAG